jgi:hypothetical protein
MEPQAPRIPESAPINSAESADDQASLPEVAPSLATPEAKTGSIDSSSQGPTVQLPPVVVPDPVQQPVAQAPPTPDPTQGVVVTSPPVADDVDIIEKEWVEKAKSIVEKTKADPHQQTTEVNMLKADYLKKRYGKEIKVNN